MRRAGTMVVLVMLVVFAGSTLAAAAEFYDEFYSRVARQQARIDNGIRKGELTPSEAQVLQDNLNWIKSDEARLRNEGGLTRHDKARLMQMLDDNSKMIGNKRKNYRRLY